MFPLPEIPREQGETGFVNAPFTSTEVRNFKKEMKPLLEDPLDLAELMDQVLGPNFHHRAEMLPIMKILFTEERSDRKGSHSHLGETTSAWAGGLARRTEIPKCQPQLG